MATRWGIVGAGKISSDFVTAVQGLPSSEHQIVAVAARQLESAKTFANRFGIPKAYGSYDELARDGNVDVAYIGTLNMSHFEQASMLLQHGKAVLCEKPMCMNAKETKALVQMARSKGLFLMEAYWSRFFPVYEHLRQEIAKGNLGKVIQVNSTFGIKIEDVPRVNMKSLGGGALLDIGVYVLQLASMAFGGRRPTQIKAVGHINEDGVDECVAISLLYDNGGMASLNITTKQTLQNDAYVVGTKGVAKIEKPFWCPTSLVFNDGAAQHFPLPGFTKGPYNFMNSEGLHFEAQETRRCLQKGLKESSVVSLDESILLAEIRDEIRKQVGVKYDCD